MLQTSRNNVKIFAEKCHTTSHRTLTDWQNHDNGGKRAKKNRRRGWTWSRKVL